MVVNGIATPLGASPLVGLAVPLVPALCFDAVPG